MKISKVTLCLGEEGEFKLQIVKKEPTCLVEKTLVLNHNDDYHTPEIAMSTNGDVMVDRSVTSIKNDD